MTVEAEASQTQARCRSRFGQIQEVDTGKPFRQI